LEKIIVLFRERVEFVHQFAEFAPYMFTEDFQLDSDYAKKCWNDDIRPYIDDLLEIYKNLDSFTHDSIHDATKAYLDTKSIKLKLVIHPLRLFITGCNAGAGMFETMETLGKERCISRLENGLAKL